MRGNESVANHMYEVANCHPKFMSFCTQAAQQAKEVCAHIHSCARLHSPFEDVHVGHAFVFVVSVFEGTSRWRCVDETRWRIQHRGLCHDIMYALIQQEFQGKPSKGTCKLHKTTCRLLKSTCKLPTSIQQYSGTLKGLDSS